MRNIDDIVAEYDEKNGWERHFREIKLTAAGYDFPYKSARLPENKDRNRYRDVSPYDHSRVRLINGESDYINGSLVEISAAKRKYILAQGPLNQTAGHFWQMVWEQNSAAVIMLNRIIEKGTIKCSQYFPLDDEPMEFTDTGYTITIKRQQVNPNYTVRYLDLKNNKSGEVKEIYQFHYTAWPDFGVPESPAAFLDFLNCVKDCGVLETTVGPAVIHCSAGIGRSGTFALVDSCLIFSERDIPFDVRETLLEMRKYRMGLIQTPQQLRFSYLAIAEGAKAMRDDRANGGQENTETDSEPTPYPSSEEDQENKKNGAPGPRNHTAQDQNRKRTAEDPHDESTDDKKTRQDEGNELPQNNHDEAVTPVTDAGEANHIDAQLRKRRTLVEKNEALKNHVYDIKNKMKESERRQQKYSSWMPYIIGGTVLLTVCTAAIYVLYH